MRKIGLLILLIFSGIMSFGQISQPNPWQNFQSFGSPTTWTRVNGTIYALNGIVNAEYSDTASANLTRIRLSPGAQIRVVDKIYLRNSTATAWIEIGSGGSGSGLNIYNSDSTLAANRTVTTSGRYIQFYEDASNYLKFDPATNNRFTHLSTSGTFSSILQNDATGGLYAVANRSDNPGIGTGGLLYIFNDGTNLELSINNNITGLQNAYDYTRNRPYSLLATELNPIGLSLDSSEVRLGKGIGASYLNIRGIRVTPLWQVYLDSIDAGGTENDSVVVIQADGKTVRRNQSLFAKTSDTTNSWRVFGNTGTNPLNNWLGPNDSVGFRIKINGRNSGFMLPGGYNSGGGISYSQQFTTFGMLAGNALIDSVVAGVSNGGLNMLIGPGAGMNIGRTYDTTAGNASDQNLIITNVGAGPYIQKNSFVTGNGRNTLVGYSVCHSCLTPGENTAMGAFAMENAYRPTKNAVFGASALRSANDASYMTAIGAYASHLTGCSIKSANVLTGGTGYTTATAVISAPLNWGSPGSCYTTATASVTIVAGVITAITIDNPGCGYSVITGTYPNGGRTEKPIITITGDGTGATAEVVVSCGSNTTSLGHTAGWLMRAPQYMIYIGSGSEPSTRYFDEYGGMIGTGAGVDSGVDALTSLTNAWAIGTNAKVSTSNSFVFGAASGGADTLRVGIGIKAPTYALEVVNPRGALIDSVHISSSGTFSGEQTSLNVGWLGLVNTTGVYNTAIGYKSQTATSTQSHNTSLGAFALRNVVNFGNTAIGSASLTSLNNADGYSNTAVGMYSLFTLTNGNQNVAIGKYAMRLSTSATDNVAVGTDAGYSITTGIRNISIGSASMGAGSVSVGGSANLTGRDNIGIGVQVLSFLTTGAYNIGIGMRAGYTLSTGSHNTFIGDSSGYNVTTGSNNVIIGSNTGTTIATASNQIILSDGAGNIRAELDSSGGLKVPGIGVTTAQRYVIMADVSGNFKFVDTTGLFGGGGSGSQTLQQVFDTEVGGSVMSKGDTILGAEHQLLMNFASDAATPTTGLRVVSTGSVGSNATFGIYSSNTRSSSAINYGVYGSANTATVNYGVYGTSTGSNSAGVFGIGASGAVGGWFSAGATGVAIYVPAGGGKVGIQSLSPDSALMVGTTSARLGVHFTRGVRMSELPSTAQAKVAMVGTDGTIHAVDTTGLFGGGGGGYTNLTEFVDQTAWRLFYSNTDGDVVELAFGTSGTYLQSNGASAAPTWVTPSGSGEANTASNVGGGLGIFNAKIGVDLEFKSLTAADFDTASNLISIDYTNGQAASGSTKGFLTSADWTTFNNKGTGTVTNVATNDGTGIIGGAITTTGTLAIDTSNIIATHLQVQHRIDSLAGTISGGGITVGTTTITSGTDTRVPFNDGGVYGEDAGMVYNKTTDVLILGAGVGYGTSDTYIKNTTLFGAPGLWTQITAGNNWGVHDNGPSGAILQLATGSYPSYDNSTFYINARLNPKQGADVASAAGAIALGRGGNTFEITGTSTITLISNLNWVNGAIVNLAFTSTATLTDGTANSGTDIGIETADGSNFTAVAGEFITLSLSEIGGTQRWREVSRSRLALQNKAVTIQAPTASENASLFYTTRAITITEVRGVMLGTSQSLTFVLNYGASRATADGTIVASNTFDSGDTGYQTTGFAFTLNTTVIPAGSYIWLTTSATSGTINDFNLTITYRE